MAPEGKRNSRLQFRKCKQTTSQELQTYYAKLLDKAAKSV